MRSPRDQTPLGPPPDNQVSGRVSNDEGHSTNALPDVVHQPQSKGHSTRGHSTRTRLSKGHSTHQLLGQDHSTSALLGNGQEPPSTGHSTRGTADHELIIRLSNELDSARTELQQSIIALETCQSSRADIQRIQASSRARHRVLSSAERRNSRTGTSPPGNDYAPGREKEDGG